MAKGDLKSSRSSGGYSGGGSSYAYNDEGRGNSLNYYEAFEARFQAAEYSSDWLLDNNWAKSTPLDDHFLYNCLHNMTYRYSIHDWAYQKFEDSEVNDGRVRRIVIKHCGKLNWQLLQTRAKEVWDRTKEEERQRNEERAAEWESDRKAAFDARIIKREGEFLALIKQAELTAGTFTSEFSQAFEYHEVYGREEGDWIDDPVATYQTGQGFGYEDNRATGIKLQVTVSLDLSNSMYYNKVHDAAAGAFRDIYIALEKMQEQYPNDLFIAAFEFSKDGYEAKDSGRIAKCISHTRGWSDKAYKQKKLGSDDGFSLGAVEAYRQVTDHHSWHFTGEDTWMYPLFEQIEMWENECSDPGAVRLDLVISDAVLEHKSDLRRSDVIQERRDGNLHTIILNLMPVEEWAASDLPLRCVQYPASSDNLGGLLRNLISEFVAVYM